MSHRTRSHTSIPRTAAAVLVGAILFLSTLVAGPALAKEGITARLDAPIALGTPGGSVLLVGVTVMVPDGVTEHPVTGSSVSLRLTGRDGSSTWELGREDSPGHYVFRIEVPAGGARAVEVGMHGESCDAAGSCTDSDLPFMLLGDPFVFGGIDATTAQLAPATAAAAADAVGSSGPITTTSDASSRSVASDGEGIGPMAIGLGTALLALLLVVLGVLGLRARRSGLAGG